MNFLKLRDPKLFSIIKNEFHRQRFGLELIASENFTSNQVMEVLGSCLTNKYSEGLPGKRYYGGNEYIDQVEQLCIDRSLKAYRLDSAEWGVNVQPYSGSIANIAAFLGLINPHDRIMGLDLPSGGHLSHGFYTKKKKVSSSSVIFESVPYFINSEGYIDYDDLERLATIVKPKLIICGASAYPRDIDYKRFREIADINDSYLLCDMAHISGLVATQELSNPFEFCDVVTTTTHKTLRGPRAGLIFFKKEFESRINESVFPGVQGGPHQNAIGAVATQMLEVQSQEFKEYIQQVKKNAKVLAEELINLGYKISTNGTENHIVLCYTKDKGVTGSKIEKICEYVDISINKNSVFGDTSPLSPGGIRLGTAALTTRGFKENDFIVVAKLLHRLINLAIKIQEEHGKPLKKFEAALSEYEELNDIRKEVNEFAGKFEFPNENIYA